MTTPLRRIAVGLVAPAIVALALAGCSDEEGVSKADVEDYLAASDFDQDQASCIADQLFDDLDEDQIEELYESDERTELSPAIGDAIEAASSECVVDG